MRIFFSREKLHFYSFSVPLYMYINSGFSPFRNKILSRFLHCRDDAIPSTIERKIRFGAISRGIGSRERINMISGRRRET